MASIRTDVRKDGSEVYRVRWREGGGRNDPSQVESFDNPKDAKTFKALVDAHGQHWPPNWVKGFGFVAANEPAKKLEITLFREWAPKVIAQRTGVDARTRRDYMRLIERLMYPWFGDLDVRNEEQFCDDVVKLWVNDLEAGERRPGEPEDEPTKWTRRPYSPKYIANLHGLLFTIMQAAVEHRPPLRSYNPCANTRLPRKDDRIEEEMVFLEPHEFDVVRSCMNAEGADLASVKIATGLRWGEISALQVRDLIRIDGVAPRLRVERAWKQNEKNEYFLGPPKSKRSRRTIAISPAVVEILKRRAEGKQAKDYLFVDRNGDAWQNRKFHQQCWAPALRKAAVKGMVKKPRIHDLRHSHVAWLIAANIPLPKIQERLGHESITTTIDRYGHLLEGMDEDVVAAVDAALSVGRDPIGGKPRLRAVG